MKKRLIAMLLMLVMVLAMLPVASFAEELPPNQAGNTLNSIAYGDSMYSNYGTINVVSGTLELNVNEVLYVYTTGVVTANWTKATIGVNRGYIDGNKGTVDENNGVLDENSGVVTTNYANGTINKNEKTVTTNWGKIETNNYNGVIETNTSVATVEANGGTINNNDGTINENGQSGRVNYNKSNGKILRNRNIVYHNSGYIYNNTGSVTDNSGTVYNYSGTVSTNTGTVYQKFDVETPPEVTNIEYVSSFQNYGSTRFFKQGNTGKIKISIKDGYSISDIHLSTGYVSKNSDGSYSITNVTAPTKLSISVKKKSPESGGTSSGDAPVYTGKEITPESPASLPSLENAILNLPNDKDPAWTTFSLLKAKGVPKSKRAIKLSWKPVPGATGYVIYGNKCGRKNKYEKITTVSGTKWTLRKLNKGTYYKYLIAAVNGVKVLAVSKTIHVATNGGKAGNNTKVTLNKKKKNLRAGKSFKLKVTLKKGPLKVKIHRKVAYESDNPDVATVSKTGRIKAVRAGTCYIYAYAQNGVFARCRVTVK